MFLLLFTRICFVNAENVNRWVREYGDKFNCLSKNNINGFYWGDWDRNLGMIK